MISNVWCLEICAGTLFLMCCSEHYLGFLMAIYTWIHLQQRIVAVRSFLKKLKLCKLAVCKLYLSGVGSYSVLRCVGPWIKFTLEYPFNTEVNVQGRKCFCLEGFLFQIRLYYSSFFFFYHYYYQIRSNQIFFYSPKSQLHHLNGSYSLYSEWHPLSLDPRFEWGKTCHVDDDCDYDYHRYYCCCCCCCCCCYYYYYCCCCCYCSI